jgi:hypothetical protein
MITTVPEVPRPSTDVIRNCRFAFRCSQQWETLSVGPHPRQRYCGECERHVVLCESDDELRVALRRIDCVAIPANLLQFRIESGDAIPYMVGQVTPPYRAKGGRTGIALKLVDSDHSDADDAGT